MSAITVPTNQAEIFARSLDYKRGQLPADVARFFLDLELSESDRTRLDELAEKARQDTLTPLESQDLEEYRRAGRLVELMRLKARAALRST